MIVIYVDDKLMSDDSDSSLDLVVEYFKGAFEVRVDLNIRTFIGFSAQDSCNAKKIHNAPMIGLLLKAFGMQDCKLVKTPLPQGLDLKVDDTEMLSNTTPFRQLVGSLLHFSNTVRPDIAFAVGYLSRFMHTHTQMRCKAGKHVLRY